MKYDVIEREIKTSSENAKKIKLKAGSKAFKILFGSIYKDIIKGVVRELFTNGWDSQKMAGTLDIPIQIHAPSKFEPYFSIRDFGTGMTPEIVDEIYSVGFASTKDDSNEQAGFMGLGSKTPLGYSDIFSLVSYVDDKYYAYEIYLDGDGDPVINLQDSGDTTEHNGVLVQLPVEDGDILHFTKMINDFVIMSTANVKIDGKKIENNLEIDFISSEGHKIYVSDAFSGVYLKMGCVLYKYSNDNAYHLRIPDKLNLIMDFPIGTFNVTASRDDIIYNNTVENLIKESYTKFLEEYKIHFEKKLEKFRTFIDANTYVHQHRNLLNTLYGYNVFFKWRSTEINGRDTDYVQKFRFKHRGYDITPLSFRWGSNKPNFKRSAEKYNKNKTFISKYIAFFDDGSNKNVYYKIQRYIEEYNKSDTQYVYIKGDSRKNLKFLLLTYSLGVTTVVDLSLLDYKCPKKIVEKEKKHYVRMCNSRCTPGSTRDISNIEKDDVYHFIFKDDDESIVDSAINYFELNHEDVIYAYKKDISYFNKHPGHFVNLIETFKASAETLNFSDLEIDEYIFNSEQNYREKNMLYFIFHDKVDSFKKKNIISKMNLKWLSDNARDKIEKRIQEINDIQENLKNQYYYDMLVAYSSRFGDKEHRENTIKLLRKAGEIT
jgi:hypothetical protein